MTDKQYDQMCNITDYVMEYFGESTYYPSISDLGKINLSKLVKTIDTADQGFLTFLLYISESLGAKISPGRIEDFTDSQITEIKQVQKRLNDVLKVLI